MYSIHTLTWALVAYACTTFVRAYNICMHECIRMSDYLYTVQKTLDLFLNVISLVTLTMLNLCV